MPLARWLGCRLPLPAMDPIHQRKESLGSGTATHLMDAFLFPLPVNQAVSVYEHRIRLVPTVVKCHGFSEIVAPFFTMTLTEGKNPRISQFLLRRKDKGGTYVLTTRVHQEPTTSVSVGGRMRLSRCWNSPR